MRKRMGKPVAFIIAAIVIIICYLATFGYSTFLGDNEFIIKSAKNVRLGIDINGGVEAYFEPKDEKVKPSDDDLQSVRAILETRMDAKNIADREVTVDRQNGTVLVRFPWKSNVASADPQAAIAELGQTAKLQFASADLTNTAGLEAIEVKDLNGKVVTNSDGTPKKYYVVVDGKNVKDAAPEVNQQKGGYVVSLAFNSEATKSFADATSALVGSKGKIAIVLDGIVQMEPTVNSAITDGKAIIEGEYTSEQAKYYSAMIKAGALPFDIESRSFSTISPVLGSGSLNVMLWAGLLAFILISVFMILYYRLPGLVACFGLAAQTAISVLILSGYQYTLTLPGIAGIILTLGMGVDTNVIIAERIREELRSGKTLGTAIETGYHRAYSAIVDGNITTLIVAVLLFVFGSGSMKSFGFTLGVGVALNFITGVTLSHLMVGSLSRFKILRRPFLYGVKKEAVSK